MTAARTEYFTFQLGPVQSFIESARTVRDLWTGSFILSWLTITAMKKAEGRVPKSSRRTTAATDSDDAVRAGERHGHQERGPPLARPPRRCQGR